MASVRKLRPNDPNSVWVVEYTDAGGKRRRQTPKSGLKKDAEAIRRKIESELEAGTFLAPSLSATVSTVCNEFMRHTDQRVKDKIIGWNRRMQIDQTIRHHIEPFFGAKLFSELTVQNIELWHDGLAHRGASKASRSTYLEILRRMEEFAVKRGYSKRRPAHDFKAERGSFGRDPIRTFNADHITALLTALNDRPPGFTRRGHLELQCVVSLAAFCGLRRGEIFGLTLASLDFDRRVIRIRTSLTGFNELKGPKTRSGLRDVPMPVHVRDMLAQYLKEFAMPNDRDLVFTSRSGKRASFTSSFHDAWRKLLKRADLLGENGEGFHFHALRHFAASWAMQMGMAPPDVAQLLGHRTFDMTLQVYAHPVFGDVQRLRAVDHMADKLLQVAFAATANATETRLLPPST